MTRRLLGWLLPLVPALLLGTAGIASADDISKHKIVDGVEIYFGVLPAEVIGEYSADHIEREMHGGVPSGAHRDHLVVALFDAATGERIGDARVEATVREIGLSGKTKSLEPMEIAETITFGNYFDLPNENLYRIVVRIRRPEASRTIKAEFLHGHYQ